MQDLNEIIREVRKQKHYYGSLKSELKKQIATYPKGSIQKRAVKNNIYYYLQYRDKGKIIQEYIGSKVPPELEKQITERQKLQAKLKPVNEKLRILNKFKV